MTSEGNDFRIFEEQVKLLYTLQPVGLMATFVNGLVITALHVHLVPLSVILSWFVSLSLLTLLRGIFLIPARRELARQKHVHLWARMFVLGMLLSGILWGTSASFLLFHSSQPHRILVAYVLGGMAAGAAGTFSAIRGAYLAYSLPALLPQIVLFFAIDGGVYIAMSGMLAFFWLLITRSAFTNRATTLASLRLRFEREDLIHSLSAARDQTEKVNEELREEVNRRRLAESELRTAHAELEEKVEERTVELRNANSQLENANRELNEFAHSVSHDLRAPLQIVDIFSGLLSEERGAQLGREGKEYVSRIQDAGRRMSELIQDLLQLSRVSQHELHREPVDLSAVVRDINATLHTRHPEREIELEVEDGLVAHCDARLVRIALENLLDNAWKYTKQTDNAHIEFGKIDREGRSVYYVKDNGIGFDMAAAGKLFAPFQRLHTQGPFPGTGIGLTTVMRIVRRHGGMVWGESQPGKGATFFFTLSNESASSHGTDR